MTRYQPLLTIPIIQQPNNVSLLLLFSSKNHLLVVAHAERGKITRIIIARLATVHERKKYEG
jgi:hypothetical protein